MTKYYLEYDFDKSRFSAEDLQIVEILKEAGKKIGNLFEKQVEDDSLPGASFYPVDATKKELEEANKKNPKILDPYTVVKRDSSGFLYAVPYHEEYANDLKPVIELLQKAASLTLNESFKAFLETTSYALVHGDYIELEKAWVRVENGSFLHLMIGPFGSYADQLFSLKKAYNFNFTFTSKKETFNPFNYVEVIRNMLPPFGSKARQNVPPEKIKVRVDDVIAIGGRNAGLPARATNYPENIEMIKEVGTKIVVYTNNIQKRDGEMLLPLFRDFIDNDVQRTFKDDFLMTNAVRLVMAHEVTEALFQYRGGWERLKGMFNYVMELHSSIVGIKACGFQLVKGVITQKDLEAILYIMLMRTFSDYFVRLKTPQVENYLTGYRVFFNYCVENGAIVLQKDTILPNPSRMYMCADQLANVVMHMFAEESEAEAKRFFDKYTSEYMYQKFSDKLASYKF
ncbi:MAG: hypothetical protein AAB443_00175 [Patescibacteria group bacterium]